MLIQILYDITKPQWVKQGDFEGFVILKLVYLHVELEYSNMQLLRLIH